MGLNERLISMKACSRDSKFYTGSQRPRTVGQDTFILSEQDWILRPDHGKVYRPVEISRLQPNSDLDLICPLVCDWYLSQEARTNCPRSTRCPHSSWDGLQPGID